MLPKKHRVGYISLVYVISCIHVISQAVNHTIMGITILRQVV